MSEVEQRLTFITGGKFSPRKEAGIYSFLHFDFIRQNEYEKRSCYQEP